MSLGLDYTPYATKAHLIDIRLLKSRNEIAHGKYLVMPCGDYEYLHDEILALMQDFYNQIVIAAISKAYLVPARV
jgi:hypothetical protein